MLCPAPELMANYQTNGMGKQLSFGSLSYFVLEKLGQLVADHLPLCEMPVFQKPIRYFNWLHPGKVFCAALRGLWIWRVKVNGHCVRFEEAGAKWSAPAIMLQIN